MEQRFERQIPSLSNKNWKSTRVIRSSGIYAFNHQLFTITPKVSPSNYVPWYPEHFIPFHLEQVVTRNLNEDDMYQDNKKPIAQILSQINLLREKNIEH